MENKINPKVSTLLLFILVAAMSRIPIAATGSPLQNFTCIGAMALFGGSYFKHTGKAFLLPLLALFLSDIVINTVVFKGKYGVVYSGWWYVYGAFALVVLIGKLLIKKVTIINVFVAAVVASLTHFFVVDFFVWFGGGVDVRTWQPLARNAAGLQQCYIQALPYLKNFFLGTTLYSAVMFGAYELLKNKAPKLAYN